MLRPHTSVYYHDDPDGIFAAYAARLRLLDNAEYVPWKAGQPLPVEAGRDVIVLDLGLTAENLTALAGACRTLLVIDHHASSQPAYAAFLGRQLENVVIQYDPQQAACVLAWHHFMPAAAVPEIVRYVADRDLWRWQLNHSRAINAAIGLHVIGADPPWQRCELCIASKGLLLSEGQVLVEYVRQQVEQIVRDAVVLTLSPVPAAGGAEPLNVPCVNASRAFASEAAERLLELYPEAAFVGVWQDGPNERRWQLRSRPDGFDVGAYARARGGGGHATAAGFHAELPPIVKLDPKQAPHKDSEVTPAVCEKNEPVTGEAPVPPRNEAKRRRI